MKISGIQKFQFSNYFQLLNSIKAKIQKSKYSISLMNWKKLSSTRATLTNPSFQSACESAQKPH